MKRLFVLLFALLIAAAVSIPLASSATIDEFLPWLAPNSTAFGTRFSDFVNAHPSARHLSFGEQRVDKPFDGGMAEELEDGAIFLYGFGDDQLTSVHWTSGRRTKIPEKLAAVRSSLILTHGQPSVETAARVDSGGSIARIVREVYRPTIDKNYAICLLATSDGVEVTLINEASLRKRGIKTSRQSYEEAERAIPATIKPNPKPSELVDYLAAEREKAGASQPEVKPNTTTLP